MNRSTTRCFCPCSGAIVFNDVRFSIGWSMAHQKYERLGDHLLRGRRFAAGRPDCASDTEVKK